MLTVMKMLMSTLPCNFHPTPVSKCVQPAFIRWCWALFVFRMPIKMYHNVW